MTSPFRINMNVIDAAQHKLHIATAVAVFWIVQEIRELPNGHAFRLPNEANMLLKAAAFIMREKLFCPFFGFSVEVEPEGGPVWLQLTGAPEIKPFIQAEMWRISLSQNLIPQLRRWQPWTRPQDRFQ